MVGTRRATGAALLREQVVDTHLRELFIADRVSTSLAIIALLIIGLATGPTGWLFVLVALIALMGGVRQVGTLALRNDRTDTAVGWFAAGSWGVSIGVVLLMPVALPILVITLAIPAVLSAMYQSDRSVRTITVGLLVSTALAGAIAKWTDGVGLEADLDPNIVSAGIVAFLTAQNLPLVLAVRHASQQFRLALAEASAATESAVLAEAEVRRSRARLAEASDAERRRIERDLHDGAQQQFLSALVQLRVLDQTVRRGRDPNPDALREIATDLEGAIEELRRLARGIYPSLLQTEGLFEAVHGLARSAAVPATVEGSDPGPQPHQVEMALYFFVSEALQNVAKHAGDGAEAIISIEVRDMSISLEVRDDGVGMASNATSTTSRGMVNMRDRIEAVGGSVAVMSERQRGACLVATVPVGYDAAPTRALS